MEIPLTTSNQKRIDTDFYAEGYATTFNKPYLLYEDGNNKYFEMVDRNALANADLSDVIMQFDHRGKVLARRSNKTLGIEPDDKGLFIFADLSKSNEARNLHEEIVNGLVTKMSWGFTVARDLYNRETRTRTILEIKKVYDVSAVSLPANADTEINARSYFNGVIEMEKQELLEQKRALELEKLKYEILGGTLWN